MESWPRFWRGGERTRRACTQVRPVWLPPWPVGREMALSNFKFCVNQKRSIERGENDCYNHVINNPLQMSQLWIIEIELFFRI